MDDANSPLPLSIDPVAHVRDQAKPSFQQISKNSAAVMFSMILVVTTFPSSSLSQWRQKRNPNINTAWNYSKCEWDEFRTVSTGQHTTLDLEEGLQKLNTEYTNAIISAATRNVPQGNSLQPILLLQKRGAIDKVFKKLTKRWRKRTAPLRVFDEMFNRKELDDSIRKGKVKKAPGPDGVTNEMLAQLSDACRDILLHIINKSWDTRAQPRISKDANLTLIFKKDKPKSKISSYRPMSLTS